MIFLNVTDFKLSWVNNLIDLVNYIYKKKYLKKSKRCSFNIPDYCPSSMYIMYLKKTTMILWSDWKYNKPDWKYNTPDWKSNKPDWNYNKSDWKYNNSDWKYNKSVLK